MTTEEYRAMEHEALDNLQRLHTLGIVGDNIAFVMSRDTYLAASTEANTICRAADYSENGEQTGIRSVYQGYDIFIINEESRSSFQPAIKGFNIRGFNYDQLSLGDFVLSESVGEDPRIFAKMQLEPLVFNDTGLTVSRQYERVASVEYPNTITEVIHQHGQYSGANSESFESLIPFEDCVEVACRLLNGERLINDISVVFQSNRRQGSGTYLELYDSYYGYTYLCYSNHPELY